MDECKVASYRQMYRDIVESQTEQRDTRRLWQGQRTIMDFRGRTPSTVSADAFQVDDLKSIDAQFEVSNNTASGTIAEVSSIVRDEHTLSVTKHDVRRANTRKAAGPDGRVLKTCTTMFNLSLAESVVPACFKWSTIFPATLSSSSWEILRCSQVR